MPNTYKLNVDFKQKQTSVVPTFVQYDDARIDFYLSDNGKVFDLTNYTTVEVTHRKPDGTTVIGDGSIATDEKGIKVVRYDYQGSEMTSTGNVETTFSIIDALDNKISIQPFKVKITTNLRDGALAPVNPEYGKLQNYVIQLETLITNNENATIAANTAASYASEQGDYALQVGVDNETRYLNAVSSVALRDSTYSNPSHGDTVRVTDTSTSYRYVLGAGWVITDVFNPTGIDDINQQLADMVNDVDGGLFEESHTEVKIDGGTF